MNLQPVAGVLRNPLRGLRPEDMRPVRIGVSIASIAPDASGLLTCYVNGGVLSRLTLEQREHIAAIEEAGGDATAQMREYATHALNWHQTLVQPQDVIIWDDAPGREVVRTLLLVAIIASLLVPGGAIFTPYLVAANVAYNLLVPPRQPQQPQAQEGPGSVFSTSLAGNAARLDQAIWKSFGRPELTPPFAAQPDVEFLPSDPVNPTVDCDQYYNALFAVGIGNHEIERVFIGKTPITHFQDVIVAQYLAPGVAPSRVLPNVVTSDEVSAGFELDEEGKYSGGFAACRPSDRVVSIGIDVAASQGLSGTAEWQVETRQIDQFGRPLGDWIIVGNESRTANTNTPQRWSNRYTLSAAIRAEVRLARTNAKNTDPSVRDGIQWIGLRAYLERPATLNEHTAYYEVVMRASQQLSNISQRDFSIIARALTRTWNPDTGWGPEIFTRNAAWAEAELWSSSIWGLGLPDERIDLQGLYDWSLTLEARQDHFDYTFTSGVDADAAAQLIAHSGRARAFRRAGSVWSVARDELADVPVMALTPRNTQPDSMVLHASLPKREQNNGIVVEYLSNITWDTATIECPCPGFSVTDPADPRYDGLLPPMDKPVYIGLDGITGAKHAEREGLYQAANMALRQTTVSAQMEMEGLIASYMDLVRWQPQIVGYGQSGDVAFWDEGTLVMGLTEQPDFSSGPLYLTLQRDDGTLTTPVLVAPGPTVWDVVLPAAPDFTLVLDDGTRERPKFILGPADTTDELVKVGSITDGGKTAEGARLFDIEAVIDDDRVHQADNHLLPGPGEIQDPIDDGSDDDPGDDGGFATLVRLSDHDVRGGNVGLPDDTYRGGLASFEIRNDGSLQFGHADDFHNVGSPTYSTVSGEWLNTEPVETAVAALYEVLVDEVGGGMGLYLGAGATIVGTFGSWQALDTNRLWSLQADDAVSDALFGPNEIALVLRVRIRRIGSTVVQETRNVSLVVILGNSPA